MNPLTIHLQINIIKGAGGELMLIKGDFSTLDTAAETRVFNYELLRQELGDFEAYKQYDGAECEEITATEIIDGVGVTDYGWQIIGTNRIVEYQWTTKK